MTRFPFRSGQEALSPYLQNAYTPVTCESSGTELKVTGRLPGTLDGLFTQIGPNPVRPPRRTGAGRYTWFTQDGMVSAIRIADGGARWFRSRWIRSRRVCRALHEARPPGPRRFPIDTVNTNMLAHGGRLLALVETGCLPVHLAPTLETLAYTDLDGAVPHGFAAHPKRCPRTGELHLIAGSPLHRWADYLVLDRDGRRMHSRRIALDGRPMIHDVALTRRHLLFLTTPVQFTPALAVRGHFPYLWDPARRTRIAVVPRAGATADVRWIDVPQCFVFHLVGAHETPSGTIELTAIRYPRIFTDPGEDPLSREGTLWNWSIDPYRGTAVSTQLGDLPHELPRSDPRRLGEPLRYFYALTGTRPNAHALRLPDTVIRHDLVTGRDDRYRLPEDSATSEAVFIPDPDRHEEDRGWIAHLTYRADNRPGTLSFLDAGDPAAGPVATVELPARIATGTHSNWIPAAELSPPP
ncbi:carotenoid oxygenase family protein [Kitasatospora sp. NPDC048540]|uniref:carotenoid oxygenase family protein n=1 Tax=unclassified Kitasatospora TaxID=2633591 RepID=UPI00053A0C88|nr:carotenoid oxygenase family protein [Kitasatospora sp. MBT63]